MPRASVVVPAFNAASTLEAAVNSARRQTLSDLEIIIVNDGSVDSTRAIADRLASLDSRIKVLNHEDARGPSAARNHAISRSCGHWIALLDADDTIVSGRLEHLVREAELRDLDLMADNLMLVDALTLRALGEALDPALMATGELLRLADLLGADWPGRNKAYRSFGVAKPIIRRTFLEESAVTYDPAVRLGEDLLFYSCLLVSGARFGVTSSCGYHYTTNANTISRRKIPTMELVDVNQRVRVSVSSSSMSEKRELLTLLDERDAALRFQVLTWSVKAANLGLAFKVAASLPIVSMAKLIVKKLRKQSVPVAKPSAASIRRM